MSFGPVSGSLEHDPDDGFIPIFESGADMADFVVEAAFGTPHNITRRTWSNGFMLRRSSANEAHVVVIHKSGEWSHYLWSGGGEDDALLLAGSSTNIRTGQDEENHVRVMAAGGAGWLFINGEYESQLDLGGLTSSGSVDLLGAWFEGDELSGHATRFADFTVRPLVRERGASDGAIPHTPGDGSIDAHSASTSLADGIVEARFFNPYALGSGAWSSGFLVRDGVGGQFHAVVVTNLGRWFHYLRAGDGADRDQRIADGSSEHISTARNGSNHIRIIAMGGEGWLFINGVYTANLDLGGWLQSGDALAVGGYFEGDGVDGRSTKFESLAIWSVGAVTPPGTAPLPTPSATPPRTPISTPTPTPTTVRTTGASSPSVTFEPAQPIAGKDVEFTVAGLRPWQRVTVEFIDPLGRPARWISEDETYFAPVNGNEVTERRLYADERGALRFARIGALDTEGIWKVRIAGLDQPMTVSYPVADLQLSGQGTRTVGVEFRSHRGQASNTYYSSRVPAALAVDVQAHLAYVIDAIDERIGLRIGQIPDLYLVWGRANLRRATTALGLELGFEGGFFWSGRQYPGIYLQVDTFRSGALRGVTHEYVHLLLDEAYGDNTPAWLNEGLAEYMEYELELDTPSRSFYRSADTAIAAAKAGALFPLRSLESQRSWNARTDDALIRLQYAQSHMAARYMMETYGESGVVDVMGELSAVTSLGSAIRQVTGVSYSTFEERFVEYLRGWEDPERESARRYAATLNMILDRYDQIRDRRSEVLDLSLTQRVGPYEEMVSDARGLLAELERSGPPEEMRALHDDARAYLARVIDWLSLELEYSKTRQDSKRVEANNMIPEVNGRRSGVSSGLSSVVFNYLLPRDAP